MDGCTSCASAARELSHAFTNGCQGCAARAVARGPNFKRVRHAGMQDRQYRALLHQMGVTHEQVKEAAAADFMGRAAAWPASGSRAGGVADL